MDRNVMAIQDCVSKNTRQTEMKEARACWAVVLYRPDARLLARLAAGIGGRRLIAVGNGPLEPAARAALVGTDVRVISHASNLGLAVGLNAAMRAAAEEGFAQVLLLDQDSEPFAGMIDSLLARAQALADSGERTGVVAPRLTPPAEGNYRQIRYAWRGDHRRGDGLAAVHFAPTSGSLMSIAAYDEVGPFRDDFFIDGIDVEWGFRAWSRGWGSYVALDLDMPHRWGETASAHDAAKSQILRQAPVRNYYYVRNVVATARLSHVPSAWRVRSCVSLAAQIGLLMLRSAPGARLPAFVGLRDGLVGRMGPVVPEELA
jgi:rhamnosyltransferase